jgi:molecular chaperone DnaK
MAAGNKSIGRFTLEGIMPAPRGVPQIEVSFDIDSNGILNVTAKDKATGKEQKIRIEASSGLSDNDIERMKNEALANAEQDKKFKEEADKLNAADGMVFNTEKQLKEFGDKIPADKKERIETAKEKLHQAHQNKDFAGIDASLEELNAAWQSASEEMYKAQGNAGDAQNPFNDPNNPFAGAGGPFGGGTNPNENPQPNSNDAEVTDVDFEEVK